MNINQCERLGQEAGYNRATFDLCGPAGRKECRWLDAYMGIFEVRGLNGFFWTADVEMVGDLWCENFNPNGEWDE